jgi:hypothetical protein
VISILSVSTILDPFLGGHYVEISTSEEELRGPRPWRALAPRLDCRR